MAVRQELFDLEQQIEAAVEALETALDLELPLAVRLEVHDFVLRAFDLGVSTEKARNIRSYDRPTPLIPPALEHLIETKKKP